MGRSFKDRDRYDSNKPNFRKGKSGLDKKANKNNRSDYYKNHIEVNDLNNKYNNSSNNDQ